MSLDKLVDIRPLKKWASEYLPRNSKLREIILLEKDQLAPDIFLARMDVWLKLLDLEVGSETIKQLKDLEICPTCGSKDVISRDRENNAFSCNNNHYWKYNEAGVILVLRELSLSEVSVKLNMLSNQYKDELCQLFKMGELIGVDFGFLDELRAAQIEMVKDGELMVFLRPDNSVFYVLPNLITNMQSKHGRRIVD